MRQKRTNVRVILLLVISFVAYINFARSFQHSPPEDNGDPSVLEDRYKYVDIWRKYGLEAIPVASRPHVVRPGEQLFHIAMQHRLPGPIQLTIDIIKELNNLWDRPLLTPGQRLRVPETDRKQWPLAIQKAWAGK